jgi:hypothetical protein
MIELLPPRPRVDHCDQLAARGRLGQRLDTQPSLRHLTLVMAKMGGISKIKVQLNLEAAMKSDSEIERDVKDELEWDPPTLRYR